MRRRILVPIRDEPELTEDAIRNSLLNWLSQPVVSASSTSNPDSDLIRIYAARNLNENGFILSKLVVSITKLLKHNYLTFLPTP